MRVAAEQKMATSSAGAAVKVYSLRSSNARLIDFTSRNRNSKVFLLARAKPSFCVRCVASEPKQIVRAPVAEEGVIFYYVVFFFLLLCLIVLILLCEVEL